MTAATTNPYVTAAEDREAAAIGHRLRLAYGIAESLVELVQDCAEDLRRLDLTVKPRRTVTLDSDFLTDFAGTQYGQAHARCGEIDQLFDVGSETLRKILTGVFDHDLD